MFINFHIQSTKALDKYINWTSILAAIVNNVMWHNSSGVNFRGMASKCFFYNKFGVKLTIFINALRSFGNNLFIFILI